MENLSNYLASGVIEQYVLGLSSTDEAIEIEQLYKKHKAVRNAIDDFSRALEEKALEDAIRPPVTIKPLLMATFDYMTRLSSGEAVSFPPLLNESSTEQDYAQWLNRADAVAGDDFHDLKVFLIGHTPTCTTAIVWIKEMGPQEVHDDEHERFLIVEGTCTITISKRDYHLGAGDYLAIPLHERHHVKVTSAIPCKVILQRVAA